MRLRRGQCAWRLASRFFSIFQPKTLLLRLEDFGTICHEDLLYATRATYLGEDFILPILPASADRYDLFEVTTAGIYRAALQQGVVRYARVTVEPAADGGYRLQFKRIVVNRERLTPVTCPSD